LPDPDLLIPHQRRNAREHFFCCADGVREFLVTDTLLPGTLTGRVCWRALLEFPKRERRYGGIGEGDLFLRTCARGWA